MFSGLSPNAQELLTVGAQRAAARDALVFMHPEHVMIALLQRGTGLAAHALRSTGVDVVAFQATLRARLASFERPDPRRRRKPQRLIGDKPPADRTKAMLARASTIAQERKHDIIITYHILLACASEEDSVTAAFLASSQLSIAAMDAALAGLPETSWRSDAIDSR